MIDQFPSWTYDGALPGDINIWVNRTRLNVSLHGKMSHAAIDLLEDCDLFYKSLVNHGYRGVSLP